MRGGALIRILLLSLSLGLSGCASLGQWLLPGSSEQPAGGVDGSIAATHIAYELQVQAPAELRQLLLSHLDLARFQSVSAGERLSAAELNRLVAAAPAQARSLLETEGYFEALITMRREREAGLQRVILQLEPGARVQIAAVEIGFVGALQDADAQSPADEQALVQRLRASLTAAWSLPVGEPFQQARWSAAKGELLARARAEGYPLARWAHSAAQIDAEQRQARLTLLLDSGPLVRLGALQIEGLNHHSELVVQRLAGFSSGQPYTEKLLLDFQERLQQTLLFDGSSVDIQPEAENAAATPVLVRLREAKLQDLTLGVGYNLDTGPRVTLEHLHRKPMGLSLRSRSKLDLGRDRSSAELEISSHPQTDMQRNIGAIALIDDRSTSLASRSLGLRLGRLRETASDERLLYVEALRAVARGEGQRVSAGAYSINGQWIRRRLDDLLLPSHGHAALLQLGLGRADDSTSASGPYGRLQLRLSGYHRLGGRWQGQTRLELGQVFAKQTIGLPQALLFRSGGDDTVRGYAYRSLGPLKDGVEVGGRALLNASTELQHPLSARLPMLWGAAFVDAGQAAERWSDLKPVWGYGLGLRLRSPVGALRLDLARGHALQRWRLHFSVGIAL